MVALTHYKDALKKLESGAIGIEKKNLNISATVSGR